jgi:lysophospholipase L1-like esterase
MSKLKRVVFWLVIGALIAMPVVLVELYLRSVGLGSPILFYANASYRFAPQPNQKQVRQRGAHVSLDSKGLRSTADWSAPADAKILFIGDSVTWGGTYIDDKATFADGVCQRLQNTTGKRFICGNAGANQYGTDNMAERIRYKDFDDESALVVTIIAPDTLRGLADAEGRFVFTAPPPRPIQALWEATTFVVWELYRFLQPIRTYRNIDDLRVAERSLQNLFSAIREGQLRERKVLIVLSPLERELGGHESALTKHVQAVLAQSGFNLLDLHEAVTGAVSNGFYYDGVHLDVSGHRFYADQIARRVGQMLSGASAEQTEP